MITLRLRSAALLSATVFLLSGCAAMDKAYVGTVGAVDPDKLKLKQETRWLNPHPNFRMVSQDKMVAYVRVRNSSGSELDISREVRMAVEDLGYRLTRNIDEAQYVMSVDIRYFGENAKADGGRATMAAGVGGGIIGGIIGHQSRHAGEGAVVGAAATALVFDTLAQRNTVREFDLVLDTRIGERVEGGVQTTRRSGDQSQVTHSARGDTMGTFEGGSASGSTSETQSAYTEDDFLYSQNRLVVYVSKLNLTPEEAEPVLRERMVRALSNVLP